ncbi:MAG: Gfo/Idh/MocA family oxidoreductase [Gammaproteobacteria bacterium]
MINIAIVGAGYMAREHCLVFCSMPECELVGICSRTTEKAQQLAAEFGIPVVCEEIRNLFEELHADVVIIAVSETAVRNVCEVAFHYPWVCLVEKPAGYNLVDAKHIAEVAKRSPAKAYVGLNRRHYSSTRSVLADLQGNSSTRFVHVQDQESPATLNDSGIEKLVLDHWMYANSIHLVDYFSVFCRGEVVDVNSVSGWQPNEPCYVLALLEFSSGDKGLYQAIWEGPGPWAVTINTPAVRYELRPLERGGIQKFGSRTVEELDVDDIDQNFKPGLRLQADELIRAVRGDPHQLPSLDEALKSMRMVYEIYGV